ncbi:MAG: hypothetical protein E6Q97_07145 [Desulfurellales bacterium]|nr:MAG: hypothetical protein E6Q97_07145 [Desulfurellales bacterium]
MDARSYIDHGKLMAALEPKITAALVEIGEAETLAIQKHLSVPVGRDFTGRVNQRSEPGDAPRMEEDILRQNISYIINQTPESFVLTITAVRPPESHDDQPHAAAVLEFGGANQQGKYVAPRPFMYPALTRVAGYLEEVVGKHFTS